MHICEKAEYKMQELSGQVVILNFCFDILMEYNFCVGGVCYFYHIPRHGQVLLDCSCHFLCKES